jgi:tetratricopeptide (TPR) repeat protein
MVASLLTRARVEASRGRFGPAEELARRAADADPTPASAELLAMILVRQRRYAEAAALFERVVAAAPGRWPSWNGLGECLGGLGDGEKAVGAFRRARDAAPAEPAPRQNLAEALNRVGRAAEAVAELERLLEITPGDADTLLRLGGLCQGLGDYAGAARCFERLTRQAPGRADAWTGLGAALQMAGDLEAARDAYQQALAADPNLADAHYNLGTAWQGLRDSETAETCFRRTLEIDPEHMGAVSGLAALLDRRGRYADALDLLRPWLDRGAEDPELVITAAQVLRHLGRAGEGIRMVRERIAGRGLTASTRQRLAFQLGDLLDAEGAHTEAFEAYRTGNRLKPVRFDRAEFQDDVERLRRVFAAGWQDRLPVLDESSERPVFVVGMPRSGTSLTEQIIAAHPDAAGAGELTDLPRLAMGLGNGRFPDNLVTAAGAELAPAAADYLARLDATDPRVLRVTDKTPSNFLFIGVIEMLFPRARVIHCVRHPLDTGLSCYFQNFAGQGIPFSYDLGDIAAHYNGYLSTMAHWRSVSRLQRFELVYEELATDQEGVTRALLEFLDLPWSPACLDFHNQDRLVSTASHAQVRRPMYLGSVGRYRNYEAQICELRESVDWAAWRASGLAERVERAAGAAGRP